MVASLRRWMLRVAAPAFRDTMLAALSLWLALELRFDFAVPPQFAGRWVWLVPVAAGVLVSVGAARGIYRTVPEFAGLFELLRLGEAVAATGLVLLAVSKFVLPDEHIVPLSVCAVATLLMLFLLGAVRFGPRVMVHLRAAWKQDGSAKRVLVVGAGKAGEMLVRDMLRTPLAGMLPVGFVDDNPAKTGVRIHSVPVLGRTDEVAEAAARVDAELALLAMPSAPSRVIRDVLGRVAEAGLRAKIIPGLDDLLGAPVTVADIRDVDIADLIGREAVSVDTESIAGFLHGRCVLVTGAAGSIGSELARQLIPFRPASLLLLDNDETEVYELLNRLRPVAARSDVDVRMLVASIRDRNGIDAAFAQHHPDVVFHAAALKHVPVMEQHPDEAVLTNIAGTRIVADAAVRHGASRFILVSTDKAVHPSSVMGATKRLAELLVATMGAGSSTVFASVRFGNVLGSRGSVVPVFRSQIRDGGPITVTHPEATRFFMTIEEAGSLIIQAGALADRGETFVLDMGEPVRIIDLAERMRELLVADRGERVPIVFTGLRPGEKIHEELWLDTEDLQRSEHPRISRVRETVRPVLDDESLSLLAALEERAAAHQPAEEIRAQLFAVLETHARPSIRLA